MQKLPHLKYEREYSLTVLAFDGKHHTSANVKVRFYFCLRLSSIFFSVS